MGTGCAGAGGPLPEVPRPERGCKSRRLPLARSAQRGRSLACGHGIANTISSCVPRRAEDQFGSSHHALALHGPDVIAILQQLGREGMPQGVAACGLGDPGSPDGLFYSLLQNGVMEMMPEDLSRLGIDIEL